MVLETRSDAGVLKADEWPGERSGVAWRCATVRLDAGVEGIARNPP